MKLSEFKQCPVSMENMSSGSVLDINSHRVDLIDENRFKDAKSAL